MKPTPHCITYIIMCTLAGVIAATVQSCEYELCYDHPHSGELMIVFDWRKWPQAQPQSMSLYICPAGGGTVIRHDFPGRDGGVITLPEGDYQAFCINSDTEMVLYRSTDSLSTFECYTRSSALLENFAAYGVATVSVPRVQGTENERVALPPDTLWSATLDTPAQVRKNTRQTITFYPDMTLSRYTVEIRGAENLQYAAALAATLTTMSGGHFPHSGSPSDEAVTVPFNLDKDSAAPTLWGRFLNFGERPACTDLHILSVYTIITDKSKYRFEFDVTDQIHNAADPRQVHIIIDRLPLPRPLEGGGSFVPTIDEWRTVRIDLTL